MRLLLRILLYPILALALAVFLTFYFLWFTERGAGFLLRELSGRVEGLSFAYVQGTASKGVVLKDVTYDTEEVGVSASRATVKPGLPALLRMQVGVAELLVQSLEVRYRKAQEQPAGPASPIDIGVSIIIEHARVDDLLVQINESEPQRLRKVEGAARLRGDTLTLDKIVLEDVRARLEGNGTIGLNAPFAIDSDVRITTLDVGVDLAQPLVVRATARGTAEEIDITGEFEIPGKIPFSARVLPGGSPQYRVSAEAGAVDLEPLTRSPISLEGLQLNLVGDGADYRFDSRSKVISPWMPAITTTFSGSGSPDEVNLAAAQFDADESSLHADGRFTFATARLTARIHGTVLARDVDGEATFTIPSLQEIEGRARLVSGKSSLRAATQGAGRVKVDADLELSTFSSALRGKFGGSGSIDMHDLRYGFDASGARLQYAEQVFEGVDLHLEGKASERLAAKAGVRSVRGNEALLGGGEIAFTGSTREGDVSLNWRHPRVSVSLQSRLGSTGDGIEGTMTAGTVSVDEQAWTLASTVNYSASADLVELGDHCWTHESASFCAATVRYASSRAALEFNLSNLAMRQLDADRLHVLADYDAAARRFRVVADGGLDLSTTTGSDLVIERVQMVLEGEGSSFRYQGSAGIANPWVRDVDITLSGSGSTGQVTVDKATVAAPDGNLAASGQFQFDPRRFMLRVEGAWLGRKLDGNGRFEGTPLVGDARLTVAGNVLAVAADGSGRIDMSIDAPDLASLDAALQGRVVGTGHLDTGNARYRLDATGERLGFASHLFTNVSLSGGNDADGGIDALLKVQQWNYGDEVLGGGQLTYSGRPADGNLSLVWQQAFVDISLQSGLGYEDGVVAGRLLQGEVAVGEQRWLADTEVDYVIDTGRVTVEDHCWRYQAASLCLTDSGLLESKGRLHAALLDLPLEVREPWFAPEIAVDGTLSVRVTGSADFSAAAPVYNGEMRIDMPKTRLAYFDDQELIADARSSVRVSNNRLAGDLSIKSDRGDVFTGFVRLPDIGSPQALRGEVRLSTGDLGVVTAFVPQLDRARGSLDAVFTVDSVSSPSIANVSVDVSDDASVVVPAAGITLTHLSVKAHGDADNIEVALSARSGEGEIRADGTWHSPLTPDRVLNLAVKGSNFQVLQRADVSLLASPEMAVVYRNSGALGIDGKLAVEDGMFRLRGNGDLQLRRPSADVVIVSREAEATAPLELDLRLDVVVKHFSVDMYGLVADVEGAVVLTQTGTSLRRAVGSLNLVNGTFSRYGQSFVVERGRLIFSGPLNNPLVDVVSSRTINEASGVVKVSLLLSGPANNIKSSIIAEPPMSSANALSYLMLGRPLDAASAAEGVSLSSAAISLGLKQAMPITEEIKSALGLTELGVVGNGTDSTSVIAGKRINPDLYVEYSYDVFSRIGGILFSYQLTPKLSVETRSGEAKSMTLVYTFE